MLKNVNIELTNHSNGMSQIKTLNIFICKTFFGHYTSYVISLTADAISYMHITLLFLNEKSNLLHVKWLVQNGFYWSTKQFRAEVHIVGDILRIDVTVILLFFRQDQ